MVDPISLSTLIGLAVLIVKEAIVLIGKVRKSSCVSKVDIEMDPATQGAQGIQGLQGLQGIQGLQGFEISGLSIRPRM